MKESKLRLNLFDDTAVMVRLRPRGTEHGYMRFGGDIVGRMHSLVTLSYRAKDRRLSGTVFWPGTAFWLTSRDDGTVLVERVEAGAFRPDAECGGALLPPDADIGPPATAAAGAVSASQASTIDVLVVYTPAVRDEQGGREATERFIRAGFDETNDALANSNISARVRPVGIREINRAENGSCNEQLTWLRNVFIEAKSRPGESERERTGADLVSMVVHDGDCGGIAFLAAPMSPDRESLAFSVVLSNAFRAPNFSFGHELAHNMGSHHNRDNARNAAGALEPGAFPYSYGYRVAGEFRTMMAYPCSPQFCPDCEPHFCDRIPFYSNPNITAPGTGLPTGIDVTAPDAAYNALSIENTQDIVAGFRPTASRTAPTLISPVGFIEELNPAFEWTTDPFADTYRLVVRNHSGQIVIDLQVTDTFVDPGVTLSEGEEYRWEVTSIDSDGELPSEPASFTPHKHCTGTPPPPTALGPTGTTTTRPTFTWTASEGAVSYHLYVIEVISDEIALSEFVHGTSFTPSALQALTPDLAYRWKVKAGNSCGESGYSDILFFTPRPDAPPPSALPIGSLDAAGPNGGTGWAYDSDAGTGPIDAHIYVDGVFHSVVRAQDSRPDLVLAGVTPNPEHGFSFGLSGLAPGTHQVAAFAINFGTGPNPPLAGSPKIVTVANAIGVLDTATATGGSGWAYDPDAGRDPIDVHIYVDGAFHSVVRAQDPRPDLVLAGIAPNPEHGFHFGLSGLAPGTHRVDAYAINVGGGPNPLLAGSPKNVRVPDPRPNIVVIMTDDQRWDSLDATHSMDPGTPVMPVVTSELAQHGVTFTRNFVTTSLCAPSRASFLTGQYAHTHGVHTTERGSFQVQRALEPQLLPVWLKNAGYRTGLFGKYTNQYRGFTAENPAYVPPGWRDWHALEGQGQYFNFVLWEGTEGSAPASSGPLAGYSTDTLRDKAVEFIHESVNQGQPFFLYFAPKAVHGVAATGLSQPAPQDLGRFDGVPPWRPDETYNEPLICDKPVWLRDGAPPLSLTQQASLDLVRQRALETSQAVDRAVGSILETLRVTGVDEKTVIIYTSDNGYFWGEHRLVAKEAPYEESIRVPLVIRPAGGTLRREEGNLVLNIDLAPTIAELVQATPLLSTEGRSLVPLLQGTPPSPPWRTEALIEHWEDGEGIPTFAGLRLLNRTYVEYVTGEKELYKLASDPNQLTNVAADPANATIVTSLAARLQALDPRWPTTEPQDLIFASDFECGDLSAWSASSPLGGDLSVASAAALAGTSLGLKAVVNDTESLIVEDDSPNNEGRYRARFYFDPNDFDPGTGNTEVYLFFAAEENPVRRLVSVELQRTAVGGYRLAAWTRLDDSSLAEVGPFDITNAPHVVEFDWKRASTAGANDGSFQLWIDAASAATPPTAGLAGLDNDAHSVDFVRLGAIGVKPGASGTLYFDGFVSRRLSFIGP